MLQTNVDIAENEATFQEALLENNTDKMWECVFITCLNIAKSIYAKRGFVASDDLLYDTAMNATCMVMRNILERGAKPEKLSSYTYLRVLCFVNGYKEDKTSKKLKDALSNINGNNVFLSDYIEEELYNE